MRKRHPEAQPDGIHQHWVVTQERVTPRPAVQSLGVWGGSGGAAITTMQPGKRGFARARATGGVKGEGTRSRQQSNAHPPTEAGSADVSSSSQAI